MNTVVLDSGRVQRRRRMYNYERERKRVDDVNAVERDALRYMRAHKALDRFRKDYLHGIISKEQYMMLHDLALESGSDAAIVKLGEMLLESQEKVR